MARDNNPSSKNRKTKKSNVKPKNKKDRNRGKKLDQKNEKSGTKFDEPNEVYKPEHPTKMAIRNLPPKLTKSNFLKRLKTKNLPEYNYFHYCQADQSLAPWHTSQAYINFNNYQNSLNFYNNWHGYDFGQDVIDNIEVQLQKGTNQDESTTNSTEPTSKMHIQRPHEPYICVVEVAKFQKIPNNSKVYEIGTNSINEETIIEECGDCGSIFKSKEYEEFLSKMKPANDESQVDESKKDSQAIIETMMKEIAEQQAAIDPKKKSNLIIELEKSYKMDSSRRNVNLKRSENRKLERDNSRKEREIEEQKRYEKFKEMRADKNRDKYKDRKEEIKKRDRNRERRDRERDDRRLRTEKDHVPAESKFTDNVTQVSNKKNKDLSDKINSLLGDDIFKGTEEEEKLKIEDEEKQKDLLEMEEKQKEIDDEIEANKRKNRKKAYRLEKEEKARQNRIARGGKLDRSERIDRGIHFRGGNKDDLDDDGDKNFRDHHHNDRDYDRDSFRDDRYQRERDYYDRRYRDRDDEQEDEDRRSYNSRGRGRGNYRGRGSRGRGRGKRRDYRDDHDRRL